MPDDLGNLRKLAEAGVEVLGTDEQILPSLKHHCDRGTWAFVGAVGAVALMALTPAGPLITLGIALAAGWAANHLEHRRVKQQVAEQLRERQSA